MHKYWCSSHPCVISNVFTNKYEWSQQSGRILSNSEISLLICYLVKADFNTRTFLQSLLGMVVSPDEFLHAFRNPTNPFSSPSGIGSTGVVPIHWKAKKIWNFINRFVNSESRELWIHRKNVLLRHWLRTWLGGHRLR